MLLRKERERKKKGREVVEIREGRERDLNGRCRLLNSDFNLAPLLL